MAATNGVISWIQACLSFSQWTNVLHDTPCARIKQNYMVARESDIWNNAYGNGRNYLTNI
ncbi:hypothetical protein L873DRAFT_1817542 [Choiromyces venosus 120613-1]|uniref:Uncharacterized protein n=1 Tax=Choiromyces venosus 120613-1 TaxID=1336337 RepID=A0A3N4J2A8_9PEZI|nr:hypothetical protein L873DRAFT_1817542 [Choiromyces venosus 120613-1]